MAGTLAATATTQAASTGLWGPALVSALIAGGIALFTLAVNQQRARKDRQRELFADAFAVVTEYREYPFIVRRRNEQGVDRQVIARDLSGVQARLNQYVARLRIEAPRVGRAYAQLVRETRRVAGAETSRSWDTEPPGVAGSMHVRDIDLTELDGADATFLVEVADHLAFAPGWARRAGRAAWAWLRHPRLGRRTEPQAVARAASAEARQ
ncbi:MAG: hypothetical protein M3Q30_09850 [Actinomycetota bacterium]|nr:hypothetical protein [Actinomycetota bacterium]